MSNFESVTIANEKMDKSIAALKREFASLRAGRANAQVLDRILVDYYGTPTPISQMANIASLWDASQLTEVEKAIQKSDLGINPSNDGKIIRLVFPELTEERRKELVKVARKLAEDSKVAIRSIRRDANDQLTKMKKENELTEDDLKAAEKEVQKVTDEHIKSVDQLLAEKEKEILSV